MFRKEYTCETDVDCFVNIRRRERFLQLAACHGLANSLDCVALYHAASILTRIPPKKINPLSFDLGSALFKRHREKCSGFTGTAESVTEDLIKEATISYKALLIKIGAPESLAETIEIYLGEVAE